MSSTRIQDFDTWRPGYGLATVTVLQAGTNNEALIYTDESLTALTDNPVTLTERIIGDISYGKFAVPLYVGVAYELLIDSIDRTGVIRLPMQTLVGEDASKATVIVAGGTEEIELEDFFARRIDVRDYGDFIAVGQPGASSTTNNTTLVAAIGAASALGGAEVDLPAGTYQYISATIPQGVVLKGLGRGVTILQAEAAGPVMTVSGARGGMRSMTLDGVSLVFNSIGIYAANINEIVLDNVEVKRFETGIHRKGGSLCDWRALVISTCVTGYKLHGDSAIGAGGSARFNQWRGGTVEFCTSVGLELKNVDAACEHNIFVAVLFDTNTGTAVKIVGARRKYFFDCNWTGNTVNVSVEDGSPLTATNSVVGLEFVGGEMAAGSLTFTGTYRDIAFRRMSLASISVTINAPGQNIPIEDCSVSNPTITGVPTCWMYRQTKDRGATLLLTTTNSATKAWALTLISGQKCYLEGKVVGRQRNGVNTGFYHISVSAGRVGATLAYDTQTANYTLGEVLTGATSGATARIIADTDAGTTGTLTLQDIVGTFLDNEIITDGAGGSATVNGSIAESAAALIGAVTAIRAAQETNANWNATFAANGPQIELQVTGDTSQTVEWSCDVDVTMDQGSPIVVAQALQFQLAYHGRTGASFVVSQTVIGGSSGASGVIVLDTAVSISGVLTLTNVSGSFTLGETLSLGGGGMSPTTAIVGP